MQIRMEYEMATKLPIKNVWMRMIVTYVPTMLLTFFYIWTTSFREALASSAYQDIFINYTGLFLIVSAVVIYSQHKINKQ